MKKTLPNGKKSLKNANRMQNVNGEVCSQPTFRSNQFWVKKKYLFTNSSSILFVTVCADLNRSEGAFGSIDTTFIFGHPIAIHGCDSCQAEQMYAGPQMGPVHTWMACRAA